MGLWELVKTNIFIHLILGYIFVMSGLIVCFLMLLTYLFVWPLSRSFYRKTVVTLAYWHWSQFTFLAQWWSGSDVTLHLENKDDLSLIGKEHVIVIMNHKYDIDWLMTWIIAERLGMLGGTKIYGKSSLRFVPLIGWAWMFTESIFLKREWEEDKRVIARDLKYITEYPHGYWVTLLLFPEGTRFTAEKHLASMEIARKKGLPFLKHHLLPRTKGFVVSMNGVKNKVAAILDITIGFRDDGASPTLMNILNGKACKAELYIRRKPTEDIPIDTDENCAKWLQTHFQEKDAIYDQFFRDGFFKASHMHRVPKRYNDLLTWLFWAVILCVPLFYYGLGFVLSGSNTVRLCVLAVIVLGSIIVRWMISFTETHKGSKYGGS